MLNIPIFHIINYHKLPLNISYLISCCTLIKFYYKHWHFFSSICFLHFRYGHSEVNTLVYRLGADENPIKEGNVLLRDVYFKPNRLENEGGLEPVLRGATAFPAQEIDLLMVDEMRNTLFPTSAATPGKSSGFDLASINIQRGRDHGLPDYNTVREKLGLKR